MVVYLYEGVNETGREVSGSVEAATEKAALEQLDGEGILPLLLNVGASAAMPLKQRGWSLPFVGRVPMAIRTLFVRELASFVHAGIPLLEALDCLRRQEVHPAFKIILDDVHDRVQGGDSFSHALSHHPRVFSQMLINMVKVGETGGLMGTVLEQMATWMEHEEEVRGEIRGAMAYPIMVLLLGVTTVIIMFSFVLPRISAIFSGQADLPVLTRILMGVAGFMGHWWWLVLLGVVALGLLIRQGLSTKAGRSFYDRMSLVAPIFGPLMRKSSIARFARANAALLGAGVPLLEALRVVRGLMGNTVMVALVDGSIERVTRGHSLAKTLEENPWFPPTAVHLLAVGERTGQLGPMFERVAQTFERQTQSQIKVLLDLLSPLLIVSLAVMVALIAVAVLLPIFRLNNMMK